jgi:hypothetical protein
MRKLFWISCLCLIALALGSRCDYKEGSLGSVDRLIALCDSSLWLDIGKELENAIEKEFYTPQPEKVLRLSVKPPASIMDLKRYPNLLVVGTLETGGPTADLLNQLLSDENRRRVEEDSVFLFKSKDTWAQNQLLVVLASRDRETLRKHIVEDGDKIYSLFNDHANERVKESMYESYEQKDIENKLLEEHDWMVRVQHDYFIAVDSAQARVVWLRRLLPEREFLIHWQSTDDPSMLSKEWMLQTRERLAKDYYDGDFVERDIIPVRDQEVNFNGRYALRLDGVWQHEDSTTFGGGPFRSYGFYDEPQGRLYMIDISVFNPGNRKWAFMRQLDVMAYTFRTRYELERSE